MQAKALLMTSAHVFRDSDPQLLRGVGARRAPKMGAMKKTTQRMLRNEAENPDIAEITNAASQVSHLSRTN